MYFPNHVPERFLLNYGTDDVTDIAYLQINHIQSQLKYDVSCLYSIVCGT